MVILVLPAAASTFQILHKFSGPDGASPYAGVTLDSAGNLYGTTEFGGNINCGCGTLFKIGPAGKFSVLYKFHGPNDAKLPNSVPVLDSAGNIYGTTQSGGTAGEGALYKFSAGTETVLFSFGVNLFSVPFSPLGVTLDSAGNFYGTTLLGGDPSCPIGSSGCGVIFKIDLTGQETILYKFTNGPDGGEPYNGVIRDAAGNLYGTTHFGGNLGCFQAIGCGTVYELDANGNFQVLKTFNGNDGALPTGRLVMDQQGNLYGTAMKGGAGGVGVVFQLVPNPDGTWTYNLLHEFAQRPAAGPSGTLVFDPSGTLWGTTGGVVGGWSVPGTPTVFKMAHRADGTWGFKVVHKFIGAPSLIPTGDLAVDKTGHIYGSAATCGATAGCVGTVFKITP